MTTPLRRKFRVHFADGTIKEFNGLPEKYAKDEKLDVRQCTGVLDGNGKPIYEKDKVKVRIVYKNIDGTEINEMLDGYVYWEDRMSFYNVLCDEYVVGLNAPNQEIYIKDETETDK